MEKYGDLLVVPEIMEILRCGKDKAYELINSKELKSFKIGRKILVPKEALIEFIEKHCKIFLCAL